MDGTFCLWEVFFINLYNDFALGYLKFRSTSALFSFVFLCLVTLLSHIIVSESLYSRQSVVWKLNQRLACSKEFCSSRAQHSVPFQAISSIPWMFFNFIFSKLKVYGTTSSRGSIGAIFPKRVRSLPVSVSHFSNSNISSIFFIMIFVIKVICDQWSLMLLF